MVRLIVCLMAVWSACLPLNAVAETGRKDIAFIEKLNDTLGTFGENSAVGIRYEDVEHVEAQYVQPYFSFQDPQLTHIAAGIKYELRTRNMAIVKQSDTVRSVTVPKTWYLYVSQADATMTPEMYKIVLSGIPALELQINAAQQITHYRILAPHVTHFTIKRQEGPIGNETTVARGKLDIEGASIDSREWAPVTALEPGTISTFFNRLINAANNP